jgi:hypothetical protein
MDGVGGPRIWYPPRSVVGLVLAGQRRVRGRRRAVGVLPRAFQAAVVRLTAHICMDPASYEPRVADLPVKIASTSVLADDGGVLRVVTLVRHRRCRFHPLARAVPGEILGLGLPDRTMATHGAALPPKGIVLEQVLAEMV